MLIGSNFCQATLRVKEFLTRNGHPYTFRRPRPRFRSAGAARPLRRRRRRRAGAHLPRERRAAQPDATCRSPTVWASTTAIDQARLRDVLVIGAGPAGLAAAVYGGLGGARRPGRRVRGARRTGGLELEDRELPRISDRHLGTGARGAGADPGGEVRGGADGREGRAALSCEQKPYAIEIDDGARIPGADGGHRDRRAIPQVAASRTWSASKASGCTTAPRRSRRSCAAARRSSSWAAGNSAGQAAVFLAQTAKRVHLLVRAAGPGREHVAISDSPDRDQPGHRAPDARRRSWPSKATSHLERVSWRDNGPAPSRRTTSVTSSR